MAVTGFFHHIGTFLLFCACVLMIITCISSPVVNDISILRVYLRNSTTSDHSAATFGTFGYCLTDAADGHDYCSGRGIGYDAAQVMSNLEGTAFSKYSNDTTTALTRVMVLHPIAAGIDFIAFVLGIGAGFFGSFLAAMVALLGFILSLVALICDFVGFAIIKNNVNSDNSGSDAEYGAAAWTLLVSTICSFIASIVLFLTCCSARFHRQHRVSKVEDGYAAGAAPVGTRRRRWY